MTKFRKLMKRAFAMKTEKTHTLTIKTPEGISFSLLLAGPVTRFSAWIVDFFCILVITGVIEKLAGVWGLFSKDLATAVLIVSYFIVSIGYGIALEWFWRGQTLGKRLFRLRVMDEQGLRLRFSQIVIRNLFRVIDSQPIFYMVGGIATLINKRAQRLGDFAANTIVIYSPKISEPDLDQLRTDIYNSFRNYPHLEARLRRNISSREANIAFESLIRRDELDADARIELFEEIADYFRSVVTFPEQAVDGISDEQYVRNVVDALYRTDKRSV